MQAITQSGRHSDIVRRWITLSVSASASASASASIRSPKEGGKEEGSNGYFLWRRRRGRLTEVCEECAPLFSSSKCAHHCCLSCFSNFFDWLEVLLQLLVLCLPVHTPSFLTSLIRLYWLADFWLRVGIGVGVGLLWKKAVKIQRVLSFKLQAPNFNSFKNCSSVPLESEVEEVHCWAIWARAGKITKELSSRQLQK